MTPQQKLIVTKLLQGGDIANMGVSGIRLRDQKARPVLIITARSFWFLRDIIKKNKRGLWVINTRAVQQLHGASWIKKEYKRILKIKKANDGKGQPNL